MILFNFVARTKAVLARGSGSLFCLFFSLFGFFKTTREVGRKRVLKLRKLMFEPPLFFFKKEKEGRNERRPKFDDSNALLPRRFIWGSKANGNGK